MPDDRSSGFYGGAGFVRFNSADTTGTASRIPDKKRSKNQHQESDEKDENKDKDEQKSSEFVDRSAQLRATLNSLAMLNVANVIKDNNHKNSKKFEIEKIEAEKIDID